jgi:methionyl-tRNA formyltransferase
MGLRIVFLGTSEFALPALERLVESEYEVVAVYTQPDRPAGRGRRERPSPVKEAALRLGLPVLQPARLSVAESVAELAALKPDVMVAAAYGQILRQPVLDLPRYGVLNIHPSLLPKYRGASPVAAAILAGDEETGVTIMRMVLPLDEGPILSQRTVAIDPRDTTGMLTERLAEEGADLLTATLPRYVDGSLQPQPQDASRASYVSTVRKEDALIDWGLPAVRIWRQVRAYNPWPVAFTRLDGVTLQIYEAWPLTGASSEPPGTVAPLPSDVEAEARRAGFAVQTGEGLLVVMRVQKEGRRALPASEFLRGERGFMGRRLS